MTATVFTSFKPKPNPNKGYWLTLGIADEHKTPNDAVQQGFSPSVYMNILERSQLSRSEFQRVTHIPMSTIKRRLEKDERFNMQESDVMYRLALLVKLATEFFDDEKHALNWLRQPVYGLSDKRPLDMVSTTADFELVKDLIGQLEHGVFA